MFKLLKPLKLISVVYSIFVLLKLVKSLSAKNVLMSPLSVSTFRLLSLVKFFPLILTVMVMYVLFLPSIVLIGWNTIVNSNVTLLVMLVSN
jgi:hypothetical protein